VKEAIKFSAFILLSIGTLGLITNEFIFDLGRIATLTFASINFVGLAALAYVYWGMQKDS
jgi:hypothetical protein